MYDFKASVEGMQKRILLCEMDERILQAARTLKDEAVIEPVLVGDASEYRRFAGDHELNVDDIETIAIEPELYADRYHEMRRHKRITQEDALRTLRDPAFYGCMLLADGRADGMVCGASWPTENSIRPALQILADEIVSSYMIMHTPKGEYLFADCGMNVQPTGEELGVIAVNTAKAAEALGMPVRMAMLSHSTEGSAHNYDQKKVMQATELVNHYVTNNNKEWIVGGELQVDAAIVPEIAKSKAPHSPLQGNANVLVFPDLDAGNIGYKLVQRFAGGEVIGPILTNLRSPVNDLSRGCTAQEVVELCYLTAWQTR